MIRSGSARFGREEKTECPLQRTTTQVTDSKDVSKFKLSVSSRREVVYYIMYLDSDPISTIAERGLPGLEVH